MVLNLFTIKPHIDYVNFVAPSTATCVASVENGSFLHRVLFLAEACSCLKNRRRTKNTLSGKDTHLITIYYKNFNKKNCKNIVKCVDFSARNLKLARNWNSVATINLLEIFIRLL